MNQSLKHRVADFLKDESGPTAVEYAVILGLLVALCIVAIGTLGTASFDMWSGNSGDIDVFLNSN
ncbi:MAG: Flp family type IVb pilin [Planctomycetota bacterium]